MVNPYPENSNERNYYKNLNFKNMFSDGEKLSKNALIEINKIDPDLKDLLEGILAWDEKIRFSSLQCLNSAFIRKNFIESESLDVYSNLELAE